MAFDTAAARARALNASGDGRWWTRIVETETERRGRVAENRGVETEQLVVDGQAAAFDGTEFVDPDEVAALCWVEGMDFLDPDDEGLYLRQADADHQTGLDPFSTLPMLDELDAAREAVEYVRRMYGALTPRARRIVDAYDRAARQSDEHAAIKAADQAEQARHTHGT